MLQIPNKLNLYNILKLSNYNVEREYYINDAGNQIRLFNDSLIERARETLDEHLQGKRNWDYRLWPILMWQQWNLEKGLI